MITKEKRGGIEETPYYSHKIKGLARGCKHCVKGEKLVLFITGICNRGCFYCPLSDEKSGRDVVYANEWDTGHMSKGPLTEKEFEVIVEEARMCDAKGAGITGGDPLLVMERTVDAIKRLKGVFGRDFHIHLYTTLENTSAEKLAALHDAGLDEIRFHPSLENDTLWARIDLAKKYRWDVGVEIPVIPGYEEKTKKLVDYLNGRISFLNLNELELSDSSKNLLSERGYTNKDDESYAVAGSEESGLALMKYILNKGYKFKVHLCSVQLKDSVQIGERLKRRAKNASWEMDEVTDEGLLIRGAIYLKETAPGFSYRKMIKEMSGEKRKEFLSRLSALPEELGKRFSLKKDVFKVDDYKLRILTSEKIARKFASRLKTMNLVPAVVEEYPTRDGLEMDIEML
jgi:pyruvate formate-lyase activating enzyme-like uncharacterized protein